MASAEAMAKFTALYNEIDVDAIPKGQLLDSEIFWRDHQSWLKESGYLLRPRYEPQWIASWITDPSKDWSLCEDGVKSKWAHLLDAISIKDGSQVMLKKVQRSQCLNEIEIGRLFSSEPLASDARNRCAPVLDILDVPDREDLAIIVMPYLQAFYTPSFKTIGEVVDFFTQTFMGVQFMHSQHVAHRDIKFDNVMMDARPLYPNPPHPGHNYMRLDFKGHNSHSSRTIIPVKYYIIDFGLSRRYDPEAPYESRLEPRWGAGDKSVPEFAKGVKCDPFAVDVYLTGNLIRERFLENVHSGWNAKRGLNFMKGLVADMTQDDPKARPTMDEVVKRFEVIKRGLSGFTLRSRCADVNEPAVVGAVRSIPHWTKQFGRILRGVPPIPVIKTQRSP